MMTPRTSCREDMEFMKLLTELKNLRGVRVLYILRALGMSHAKDTLVGNALVRGLSGGERKRVTLAEM